MLIVIFDKLCIYHHLLNYRINIASIIFVCVNKTINKVQNETLADCFIISLIFKGDVKLHHFPHFKWFSQSKKISFIILIVPYIYCANFGLTQHHVKAALGQC